MTVSPALSAASTRAIILAILNRRDQSYGYEIIQLVHSASGGRMEWKDGMLYPVLHRMEREGLIACTWGLSKEGRRRKYYSIQPKGREALESELQDWFSVYRLLLEQWKPATGLT